MQSAYASSWGLYEYDVLYPQLPGEEVSVVLKVETLFAANVTEQGATVQQLRERHAAQERAVRAYCRAMAVKTKDPLWHEDARQSQIDFRLLHFEPRRRPDDITVDQLLYA